MFEIMIPGESHHHFGPSCYFKTDPIGGLPRFIGVYDSLLFVFRDIPTVFYGVPRAPARFRRVFTCSPIV